MIEVFVVANQYLWRFTGFGMLLGEIEEIFIFITIH